MLANHGAAGLTERLVPRMSADGGIAGRLLDSGTVLGGQDRVSGRDRGAGAGGSAELE